MGVYQLHQSLCCSCSIITACFRVLIVILFWCMTTDNMAWAALANSGGGLLTKNNETDRLSLLAFKKEVTLDPTHVLDSWNASLHFCSWPGVTCGRKHQRVVSLDLHSRGLEGSLSPHLGNLSFLRQLSFYNNSFNAEIPQEIGRLFRLENLLLFNNTFNGKIPVSLSNCSNLVTFDLEYNKLEGGIPHELSSLTRLRWFSLQFNRHLNGVIPPFIGNLSSLSYLHLMDCGLQGTIPPELGQLSKISELILSVNQLNGEIPPSLFSNMSSIHTFQMGENKLVGKLPLHIDVAFPDLRGFSVLENQMTGYIPPSFWNLTSLELLDLSGNNFVGSIPEKIGKLTSLLYLNLANNQLGDSSSGNDLVFLNSLTNSTKLTWLKADTNNFQGFLPSSIVNLSTDLQYLFLGNSQIYGTIHQDIKKLINLKYLVLDYSLLTGAIPPTIGELSNLQVLSLESNKLTGPIPATIGNLSSLFTVSLASNQLTGYVPSSLGNCANLDALYLSMNGLTGSIPAALARCSKLRILVLWENNLIGAIPNDLLINITSLMSLNLGNNALSGPLPQEVGNLATINQLIFSNNQLSGPIPNSLGQCRTLQTLSLDNNAFEGNISASLSDLKDLRQLGLSHNQLGGPIPSYLSKLKYLEYLNLSYNNFEGYIPIEGVFKNLSKISLQGNEKLCCGISQLHFPPCREPKGNGGNKKAKNVKLVLLVTILGGGSFILVLLLCFIFIFRKRTKRKTTLSEESLEQQLHMRMVSYKDILNGTNNFSTSNLLGMGSFGVVYKGILGADQLVVAVKVFDLQKIGASKSFISECVALQNIRHRNLVKILTCCSGSDYKEKEFKALVYEFMENGTLESWLYPEIEQNSSAQSRHLGLRSRLEIAIDVAHALDYLHNHSHTPVVHCDLKPSNILLDQENVAHVSDFGLAKLLLSAEGDCSSQVTSTGKLKGTIGYIPPEYGTSSYVTTRGDVFSYGVILLEMLIGKRPTHEMFKENLTITTYARKAFPDHVLEIVDQQMFPLGLEGNVKGRIKDCIISMMQVGIECSSELSSDRMEIGIAKSNLERVRKMLSHGGGI